ncbi:uncharacterized protein BDR25DRAFT_360958 [Lindgomyces ingoldianus]|uniref:Uncharacterized protein n=1 Tax=Lindgomyces ingoldianus TaxID=673940 RepID=A0ACB6QFB9_9PLEO|nr:uncharacterized protein BDR25DRAFT_360958 [Lindgomyces ingoldianus]KAF2465057.1 hypothetical protein BDR25DRAFT_360958 [Lindgomyces ingoldianus]
MYRTDSQGLTKLPLYKKLTPTAHTERATQRGLTAKPLCALEPPVNTGCANPVIYRAADQKPTACVATQRRLLISSPPSPPPDNRRTNATGTPPPDNCCDQPAPSPPENGQINRLHKGIARTKGTPNTSHFPPPP